MTQQNFQNPDLISSIRQQYGIDITPKPYRPTQPARTTNVGGSTESEKIVYIGSVIGDWLANNLTEEQGELALKALATTWQYRRVQKREQPQPKETT